MKNLTIAFILFLFSSTTFAQKLSDVQIINYLEALQKEKIISEFGKDSFLKFSKNEGSFLKNRNIPLGLNKSASLPDSIIKSRAAILGFIGIFELMRNVGSAADELVQIRELSEKMLDERMFFKPEMEGELNSKNPITFLGAELNMRPNKENYLILANRLKAINIIDQKVYDELLIWLKKDQITLIKDFGFFIYAAKQTYFYDNYEALKNEQLKFIDSLQSVNLLQADKAKTLKDSYKAFEVKSKIDILANCKNAIIIPSEQGNLTREEIYQNLFNQVKNKLITDFNFSELKVSEISKIGNENQGLGLNGIPPMGIPFANPLGKNKSNYKLNLKVNNIEYSQRGDTDFFLIKTLQKSIPPDVHIDSSVIKTYANVFSFITGITSKDFQIINDFLTDRNSPKRLIVVSNDYNPFVSIKESRKVLILVDSTQNAVFGSKIKENPLFANLLGEKTDFSNKFSRENIYAIIEDFQKNDILPILEKTEIEKKITELRFELNNRKNISKNILISFPQVVAKVNFIPKKSEEKLLVFKQFIAELSRVSHGQFLPEKISDNFESEIKKGSNKDRILKISYRFNGKKYEAEQLIPKIEAVNDAPLNPMYPSLPANQLDNLYFNEIEWLSLVNKSLVEKGTDGQFYKLKSGFNYSIYRNEENYIFLSKSQMDFFDKKHSEVFKDTESTDIYGDYKEQVANFNAETFANALKREKMLTEEHFKTLVLKKAKEPSEILKISNQAVVIDMNELSGKSNTELYNYAINKVAEKLIPEAKFSNIKYLKDDISDTTENDFAKQNISGIINGKPYEQTLTVSLKNTIQNALDSLKKSKSNYFPSIGENQFKIINDYLTDISSPNRLVIVCDYQSPMLSFVLFDSTQANLVAETLPNNYVDFAMYDRQFSRDSMQVLLENLHQFEIIKMMSNDEKDSFIVKFRRGATNGITLLESLSNVVVQSNIWGVDSYKNVYKSFIDSLKTISKGQFNPTNVNDNFAKILKKSNYIERSFQYSFVLNEKKYGETQIVPPLPKAKNKGNKINYEYLDFDTDLLLNLINQALNDANSEYNFHQIYSEVEDEGSVGPKYIFLNNRQFRWLKGKYPEIFDVQDNSHSTDTDDLKEEK